MMDLSKVKESYLEERENGMGSHIKDDFHTMSELYFNRMVLFSIILKHHRDKAWRSKLHADGSMFNDFFIVGVSTPAGDYAYHYHIKYWEWFDGIKELDHAPEWDGHQSSDIGRLYSLLNE